MRVLVFHNRYRHGGGEDRAVEAEVAMLRNRGAEVRTVIVDNPPDQRFRAQLHLARNACWSKFWRNRAFELCREFHPDAAHVHNFWMELSPAVHAGCSLASVPTVQSLHNFRLLCANALLLRDGRVCEDCAGHSLWRGVARRCYRSSAVASAAVACMVASNRRRGTWTRFVDVYIAPSEFARSKFAAREIPAENIFVKPNAASDWGVSPRAPSQCHDILFVGRLSPEKGVDALLRAWAQVRPAGRGRLIIAGDGPEAERLRNMSRDLSLAPDSVVFAGRCERSQVREYLNQARAAVLPSLCYETFGMSAVEAFCSGRPALVSEIGALPDIVRGEVTGLTFPAGNTDALALALERALSNPELCDRLGRNARQEFETRFSTERNFDRLMEIYEAARERRAQRGVR